MRTIRISCLLVLFLSAGASAGVVPEFETQDYRLDETGMLRAIVDGKDLKMTITSGSDEKKNDMIYRGAKREMVVVDHDEKSFMVIDEAMVDSISDQLSGYEAQMREALKDVPPEQRAMVEQMMKGRMPAAPQKSERPVVEITNTGERDTKHGYPSVKYEVTTNGRKTVEYWVTDWDNVAGGEDAVEAFKAMATFLAEMQDSMPSFGGDDDVGDNPFEHMNKMEGFPVLTHEFADDGSIASESKMRSSEEKAVQSTEFEPPAAYKRLTMMSQ